MIGLLLDQGLPRSAADRLRNSGWDAVHTGEIGLSAASDSTILAFAREHNRVVVTLDADFHALLAVGGGQSPSVVRIRREGLDAEALAKLLLAVLPQLESALHEGAMVSVLDDSVRVRLLPVKK